MAKHGNKLDMEVLSEMEVRPDSHVHQSLGATPDSVRHPPWVLQVHGSQQAPNAAVLIGFKPHRITISGPHRIVDACRPCRCCTATSRRRCECTRRSPS